MSADSLLARRCGFFALQLFVLSMLCSDGVIGQVGTPGKIYGLLAFVVGAVAVMKNRRCRMPTAPHAAMGLFVFLEVSTWLWSIDPASTSERALTFVQLLGATWLLWEFVDSQRRLDRLMNAFVLGSMVPILYTIVNYMKGDQFAFERYSGAGFDANELGVFLAISIVWSIHFAVNMTGWSAWLYRLQIGLATFAIVLTASRTAFVAAVIALFYLLTWTMQSRSRVKLLAVTGTIAVLLVLCVAAPSASWERIRSTLPEIDKGDLTQRTIVWRAGWDEFELNPILGVGAGAFGKAVEQKMKDVVVAHNTFLSVLTEGGLLTFIAFSVLCGLLFRDVLSMPASKKTLWLFTLTVWVVGASTLTLEHRKPTWLIFGLIPAQFALADRRAKLRVTRMSSEAWQQAL